MLDNSVKREVVKASAAVVAGAVGKPALTALAAGLGVAVEALGYLGEKRTRELFYNDPEYVEKIVQRMGSSDDFISLVYSVWVKHNLESSETRRQHLRNLLQVATSKAHNDFQNFTRMLNAVETINEPELMLLERFYAKGAHAFSESNYNETEYRLNIDEIQSLLEEKRLDREYELTDVLNQLGHLGLIGVSYNAMNGPYYWPVSFGRLFLEYIKS